MAKKYTLFSFLLAVLNVNAQTTNPIFLGSCKNDVLREMVLHDGHLYGVGSTYGFDSVAKSTYLFKTDTLGQPVWARMINTSTDEEEGISININQAGHIVITSRIAHENGSIMLAEFNTNGTFIQAKAFNNQGLSITATAPKSSGGLLMTGYLVGASHYYPVIVSTDAAGNLLWSKTLSGNPTADSLGGNGIASGITETASGQVMVTGSIQNDSISYPFLAAMDASGNVLWLNTYDMPCMDGYGNVLALAGGDFALCGSTLRTGGDGADPYMIKTDASGNVLFSYVYNIDQTGLITSLPKVQLQAEGNNFILTGTAAGDLSGSGSDYYAIHINSSGEVAWSKKYGNSTGNVCHTTVVNGNNLMLGGFSAENTEGNAVAGNVQDDIMILKTNLAGTSDINSADLTINRTSFASGEITFPTGFHNQVFSPSATFPTITNVSAINDSASCYPAPTSLQDMFAHDNMNMYPNPATVYTEITTGDTNPFDLMVHSSTGKLVFSQGNILNGKFVLETSALSPGIYIVTTQAGGQFTGSRKLVVQ